MCAVQVLFALHRNGILKPSLADIYCPGQSSAVKMLWGWKMPTFEALCPKTVRIAYNHGPTSYQGGIDASRTHGDYLAEESYILSSFLKYFDIRATFLDAKCWESKQGGKKLMDSAASMVSRACQFNFFKITSLLMGDLYV